MFYVISYDIPDDKVRGKVSDYLEGWGYRVQESVFECRPRPGKEKQLWRGLKKLLKGQKGNILVYQVCAGCLTQSFGIGEVVETPHGKGPIII
ncbi:MAG: CRISPR-associated endonuclease Cas2 [Candidatus Zixiibacteriota bacterium]